MTEGYLVRWTARFSSHRSRTTSLLSCSLAFSCAVRLAWLPMKFARGSLVALGQESSRRIVIFFAHPDFDRSHTNRALRDAVSDLSFVTFNDLYETYPDLLIDVKKEQALALSADLLVFQHPFF